MSVLILFVVTAFAVIFLVLGVVIADEVGEVMRVLSHLTFLTLRSLKSNKESDVQIE
jgi:hypothetical protein